MKSLRIILIDQLTPSISALEDINKFHDVILMCEHHSDLIQVKHHKKKLAFWLSAMRHFAEELTQQDYNLIYRTLDGADNLDCWPSEIKRLQASNHFDRLIITSPSDYSMLQSVQSWSDQTGLRVDIRPDNRFICSPVNHGPAVVKAFVWNFFIVRCDKITTYSCRATNPKGGSGILMPITENLQK